MMSSARGLTKRRMSFWFAEIFAVAHMPLIYPCALRPLASRTPVPPRACDGEIREARAESPAIRLCLFVILIRIRAAVPEDNSHQ